MNDWGLSTKISKAGGLASLGTKSFYFGHVELIQGSSLEDGWIYASTVQDREVLGDTQLETWE